VNKALSLVPSGTLLSPGTVGKTYTSGNISTYVTASGGTGTGYTYRVTDIDPPDGLSYSPKDGEIKGTPQRAETLKVTVTVTDSAHDTAFCTLTLKVNPR
jgi:hypothetical protein